MTLLPYQERVVAEKADLDIKINALTAFFPTQMYNNLNATEKTLMRDQRAVMMMYSGILEKRIAAWELK
jgi:hypothetical protein